MRIKSTSRFGGRIAVTLIYATCKVHPLFTPKAVVHLWNLQLLYLCCWTSDRFTYAGFLLYVSNVIHCPYGQALRFFFPEARLALGLLENLSVLLSLWLFSQNLLR